MVRHFFSLLFSTVKNKQGQKDGEGIHLEFDRIPNDSKLRRFFSPKSDICSLVADNGTDKRNIWADIICGHNTQEELEARNNSPIYYIRGKEGDEWIDGGWELDSGWKNVIRIICWLLRDYKAAEDKELESYSDKAVVTELQRKKEEAQSVIENVNQNKTSLENSTDITHALDVILGIRSDIEFKVNRFSDVSSQNNHNEQIELYGNVQIGPQGQNRQKNDIMNFIVNPGHAYVGKIADNEKKQTAQQRILEQDSNELSGFNYIERLYIDKKYLSDEDIEKYPWIEFWGNINYRDNVGVQETEKTITSIINLLETEEGLSHIGGIIRFIQNDSGANYYSLFDKIKNKLLSNNSEFFIRNSISFFDKLKHNDTANSFISSVWYIILAKEDGYKYIQEIFRTNDEFLKYIEKQMRYYSLPDSLISNVLYLIKDKESPAEFIKLIGQLTMRTRENFSKELHEIVNDKLIQALDPNCKNTYEILEAILSDYYIKENISYNENIIGKITSYVEKVLASKKLNPEKRKTMVNLCRITRVMVENSQFDEASFEFMLQNALKIFTKMLDLNYDSNHMYDYHDMVDTFISLLKKGDIKKHLSDVCSLFQRMQECGITPNIACHIHIEENSPDIFIKNALLLSPKLDTYMYSIAFNVFYNGSDKYTNDIKGIMLSDSEKANDILRSIEEHFIHRCDNDNTNFAKKTLSFATELAKENISMPIKAKIAKILLQIKPIISRTEDTYDFSEIDDLIKETLNQLLEHPSYDLIELITMFYKDCSLRTNDITADNLPFDKTKLEKLPACIDYIMQNKEMVATVGQLLDLINFDQVDQATREIIKRFADNNEKAFIMSLPVERSKEKTELLLQLSKYVDLRNANDIFQKYPELCQNTSNALLIFDTIGGKLRHKILDGIKKEDLTPKFIGDLFNTEAIRPFFVWEDEEEEELGELGELEDEELRGFKEEKKEENGEVINDPHTLAKWVLNNYPKLSEVKDIIEEHLSEQEKKELEKKINAEGIPHTDS